MRQVGYDGTWGINIWGEDDVMKKITLTLLVLAPPIIGYLYNLIFSVSLWGFLLYLSPISLLLFWFWVGWKFAETNMNVYQSVFIGNSLGIVSLIIYLWQFLYVSDEHRNMFLAVFSQGFSSCLSIFTARFAILFEPEKNVIGNATYIATQVLGLLLMATVFTIGYYWHKRKTRI